MSFLHPEFLYLMLPPVFLLFYFILTQKEPTAELFDSRIYERLRVKERRLGLRHRNLIYLLIFILLITAMAQPVVREARITVHAPSVPLVAAIDISASMQTEDLYPSRLAVAKAKLQNLIEHAETERVGVMAYGKDVYAVSPPTADRSALRSLVAHFKPDTYAEAGTDLMALLVAADGFMEAAPQRTLLLLTDGGDAQDMTQAIAFANAHHLRLFILGTATPQGGVIRKEGKDVLDNGVPVITALNPALGALAEGTGGIYVPAEVGDGDVKKLLHALRAVTKSSGKGSREIEQYGQLYILPLGLALFLLLVATSSMSRRETIAVPPVLLLGVLLLGNGTALKAEMYDYELLEAANTLYEQGQYSRAANAYYRYAKHNGHDAAAYYNSAHALYRDGKYGAAIAIWGKLHSRDRLLEHAILHNLGNAYAMLGSEADLHAAIKAYERALRYDNDLQTRENLETVRGRLVKLIQQKRAQKAQRGTGLKAQQNGTMPGKESARGKGTNNAGESASGERTGHSAGTAETDGVTVISDYEAAMWMKTLQEQPRTYLFKITPKMQHGAGHVSPW